MRTRRSSGHFNGYCFVASLLVVICFLLFLQQGCGYFICRLVSSFLLLVMFLLLQLLLLILTTLNQYLKRFGSQAAVMTAGTVVVDGCCNSSSSNLRSRNLVARLNLRDHHFVTAGTLHLFGRRSDRTRCDTLDASTAGRWSRSSRITRPNVGSNSQYRCTP